MHGSIDALDQLEEEEASDRRVLGAICYTTTDPTQHTGLSDED